VTVPGVEGIAGIQLLELNLGRLGQGFKLVEHAFLLIIRRFADKNLGNFSIIGFNLYDNPT
jgi:hypothetical protein